MKGLYRVIRRPTECLWNVKLEKSKKGNDVSLCDVSQCKEAHQAIGVLWDLCRFKDTIDGVMKYRFDFVQNLASKCGW